MAFWSSETLKTRVEQQKLIEPYDPEAIKHAAYELMLGGEAFVTSFEKGVKQVFKEGDQLRIPPGQFGLLLTGEVVKVPTNAIAFISIRASVKFRGLVNISGFHVDPGYEGQLQFSVYNAGSQTLILDPGKRIFMIWYADLDQGTQDGYNGSRGRRNGISAQDVENIQGDIASPGSLKQLFDDLEKNVDNNQKTLQRDYEKQLDDLRQDYKARISGVEKDVNVWRGITIGLILMLIGAASRPLWDRSSPQPIPTAITPTPTPGQTPTPRPTVKKP